jgi:hypothetical protein
MLSTLLPGIQRPAQMGLCPCSSLSSPPLPHILVTMSHAVLLTIPAPTVGQPQRTQSSFSQTSLTFPCLALTHPSALRIGIIYFSMPSKRPNSSAPEPRASQTPLCNYPLTCLSHHPRRLITSAQPMLDIPEKLTKSTQH